MLGELGMANESTKTSVLFDLMVTCIMSSAHIHI